MVREIITPKKSSITLKLPREMVGKTVEVIAFEIDDKRPELSKAQRLKHLDELTKNTLSDLSGFKFDRDQANDYD